MANITKRTGKNGTSYRIRVSCCYDSSGKQLVKSTTWVPAPGMTPKQEEKELQRQAVIFEEKCKTGQILDGTIRFADYVQVWLRDYAEKNLRKTTLARYKELLNRILPAIGHIKLERLQPHHLYEFYSNLEESGIRADTKYKPCSNFKEYLKGRTKAQLAKDASVSVAVLNSCTAGKNIAAVSAQKVAAALNVPIDKLFTPEETEPLAAKTILHYHRLISSILAMAVEQQVLFSNPCDRTRPPKVEQKEARYLDEVQASRLLELIENEPHPFDAAIKTLIYTGMRRGELCGLEWKDLNFFNNTISIERSSLYLSTEGVFEDTTKTYSSKRVIKVPTAVIQMLREYQVWQKAESKALGSKWVKSDRIFTAWNGKPIHPDTLTGWFHDFVVKNDLPYVSIHSLRHTNATLLIAAGTPLKTVSSRLGHSNLTTTGNIYAHAIKSADEAAADTLQDILTPSKHNIG